MINEAINTIVWSTYGTLMDCVDIGGLLMLNGHTSLPVTGWSLATVI